MARSELFNSQSSDKRFDRWPGVLQNTAIQIFSITFGKVPKNFNYNLSVPSSVDYRGYTDEVKKILKNLTCFLDDVIVLKISDKDKHIFDIVTIGVLDEDSGEYVIDELCISASISTIRLKYDTVDSDSCGSAFHQLFKGMDPVHQFNRISASTTVIGGVNLRYRHQPNKETKMIDPTMSFAPTPKNSGIGLLEAVASPSPEQEQKTDPSAGMTARSFEALVYNLMNRYLSEEDPTAQDYTAERESYKQGEDQVHSVTIKRLRDKTYSRVVPDNALVLKLIAWPNFDLTVELTNGENWKIFVVNIKTDNVFVRSALLGAVFVMIGKPATVLEENKAFFDLFDRHHHETCRPIPEPKSGIEKEFMRILEATYTPQALSKMFEIAKQNSERK